MVLFRKFKQLWLQLNAAQRSYLVATLFVLLWLVNFNSQVWPLYGMALALLCAVSLDMWQGFLRIWNSLAGKAVVIVFYAVLGNFCFAMAESQVNHLIGVRPDVVPYTVNLTVLLLAPLWSFGLSLVMLSIYTLLHTAKIFLLLFLRPLGVRSHHLLGKEAYPVWTLLTRFIYLPVFMSCLSPLPGIYLAGDSSQLERLLTGKPSLIAIKNKNAGETADSNAAVTVDAGAKDEDMQQLNVDLSNGLPRILWLNRTQATFLYHVESLSRSSCPLFGKEHLVHINDHEVLVITPDEKAETGYQYQVRLCGSVGYRRPEYDLPEPSPEKLN
jgi:hypothetical protein